MIGFMKLKALVAITALTMALSAAAAYAAVEVTGSGSYGGTVQTETDSDAQTKMLAVKNGDTIQIAVTGVSSDKDVTLLSYKLGSEPNADTIQYVDQYAVTGNTLDISFKVRNLDVGVYKLVVNDGTSANTLFYKVGYPGLVDDKEATTNTYFVGFNVAGTNGEADTVSVAYRAKMTGGSVKNFGFDITGAKNYTFTTEFAEGADVNVSGDYTFDMTISGIPTTELETLNSLTVTPFVNFN
jgi:hypothetical protein